MNLNIGSSNPRGKYRGKDWINIDFGEGDFEASVRKIDACDMPKDWADRFEEIHAVHVLEHINRNLRFQFASECYRVLKPGGVAYIEVPDFEQVVMILNQAMEKGNTSIEHNMTTSIFGKQRYVGDQHCWGYTKRTLSELLEGAGFKVEMFNDSNVDKMISSHYKQEPVLLARAVK